MIRVNSFNNKVLLAKAEAAEAYEEAPEEYEIDDDDYEKITSDSKREVKDGRVSFKKEEDYSSYAYNDNDDDNEYDDDRDFTGTQKIDSGNFEEEDFGETTIIDQDEILYGINRQNRSNKDTTKKDYPIIGKLAPYSKGELDV